ncbi:alpha/beta hydrolase [Dokdonella sp.]|uniref:alpha/beta hydrolase n=1 Tax=Dokdonella sp. TaxID=2291710 RepID=UPI001B0E6368|nr:alpha/beta hydrolase [Dokdonella sp.]MBO9664056.1 alpha/beta hydrolase [Dokdonella sp.]
MAHRISSLLACAVGWWTLAGGTAVAANPQGEPAAARNAKAGSEEEHSWLQAVWQPPSGLQQTPIWPNAAPDMEGVPQAPERIEIAETPDALEGHTSEAAWDVTVPTMTVFPPKGKNTGVAMIVFPGGGFKAVVLTKQGTEICGWITSKGITCILSKYRVPKSNHHWDSDCRCAVTPKVPRALQDAQRTIRLVRARAGEWGIRPDKIGVVGFSAGGYLVVQTSNIVEPAYEPVDATDRISSRPDFAIAFYPGHLCRSGGTLDPGIHVTQRTPPTFLLQAWDDPVDEICNSTIYARALDKAGVPAEVHLFAKGGHAFGLRRSKHPVVAVWPSLVESWLEEIGVL